MNKNRSANSSLRNALMGVFDRCSSIVCGPEIIEVFGTTHADCGDILASMSFTALRAELIAIKRFDELFFASDESRGDECLAVVLRCVRRNELLRQMADLVAQN